MPEGCEVKWKRHKTTGMSLSATVPSWSLRIGALIEYERFSNAHKLLRVTAYVERAARF